MKLLTCKPLPSDENEFFELIRNYFPTIYDIKYLMQWKNLKVCAPSSCLTCWLILFL